MKFLVCGLGNIGVEYELTRHNIGFLVLDRLAQKCDVTFKQERLSYHAEAKYKGRVLHLVKPTTYMNLSGKALRYWLQEEKINIEHSIVVTDDLSLPYGKIRLKAKGSNGGHNGLGNIEELLNSSKYPRLRFGVGDDYAKGKQVDYVLGNFSPKEMDELQIHIDRAVDAILSFVTIGLERTMNSFN